MEIVYDNLYLKVSSISQNHMFIIQIMFWNKKIATDLRVYYCPDQEDISR